MLFVFCDKIKNILKIFFVGSIIAVGALILEILKTENNKEK